MSKAKKRVLRLFGSQSPPKKSHTLLKRASSWDAGALNSCATWRSCLHVTHSEAKEKPSADERCIHPGHVANGFSGCNMRTARANRPIHGGQQGALIAQFPILLVSVNHPKIGRQRLIKCAMLASDCQHNCTLAYLDWDTIEKKGKTHLTTIFASNI